MRRLPALPVNVGVERERAENGDIHKWLGPTVVAKLKALRGPAGSYSDIILRLASAGSRNNAPNSEL
jgi:hypothetical protein